MQEPPSPDFASAAVSMGWLQPWLCFGSYDLVSGCLWTGCLSCVEFSPSVVLWDRMGNFDF